MSHGQPPPQPRKGSAKTSLRALSGGKTKRRRKAPPPSGDITLPLSYALAAEDAGNALSSLLEDGLHSENVEGAWRALRKLSSEEVRLPKETKEALGLWE